MKKIFFLLSMAVLAVNLQAAFTPATQEKPVRTVVMTSELPKAITDNIAKDYAGYTIKEAASVTTNGAVTYELIVVKGTTTETLVYDKDGKFVKKLPPGSKEALTDSIGIRPAVLIIPPSKPYLNWIEGFLFCLSKIEPQSVSFMIH